MSIHMVRQSNSEGGKEIDVASSTYCDCYHLLQTVLFEECLLRDESVPCPSGLFASGGKGGRDTCAYQECSQRGQGGIYRYVPAELDRGGIDGQNSGSRHSQPKLTNWAKWNSISSKT
jgi:hypothetical protein